MLVKFSIFVALLASAFAAPGALELKNALDASFLQLFLNGKYEDIMVDYSLPYEPFFECLPPGLETLIYR